MHLTIGNYVLWAATSLLEMGVCAYVFRRRLYLRLPLVSHPGDLLPGGAGDLVVGGAQATAGGATETRVAFSRCL